MLAAPGSTPGTTQGAYIALSDEGRAAKLRALEKSRQAVERDEVMKHRRSEELAGPAPGRRMSCS